MGYDGTEFSGFQQQPGSIRTVEGELKKALNKMLGVAPKVIPAGRTDSGVHATGQVINFKIYQSISDVGLCNALNSLLPKDIQVHTVQSVSDDFHARFASKKRTYKYYFTQEKVPIFYSRYVTEVKTKLNMQLISEIPPIFLGQHNFRNFKALGSTQKSDVKEIFGFSIEPLSFKTLNGTVLQDIVYELKITANGFLYKMVRNIVGSVWEVLRGKIRPDDLQMQLKSEKKLYQYPTAPSKGLWLDSVEYD